MEIECKSHIGWVLFIVVTLIDILSIISEAPHRYKICAELVISKTDENQYE
jgi:hypothetical protein